MTIEPESVSKAFSSWGYSGAELKGWEISLTSLHCWETLAVWACAWQNLRAEAQTAFSSAASTACKQKGKFYTHSLTGLESIFFLGLCFLEVLSQGGGAVLAYRPVRWWITILGEFQIQLDQIWLSNLIKLWSQPCFKQQVKVQNVLPYLYLSMILWYIWSFPFLKDCLKWDVQIEGEEEVDSYNCNCLSFWIGSTCKTTFVGFDPRVLSQRCMHTAPASRGQQPIFTGAFFLLNITTRWGSKHLNFHNFLLKNFISLVLAMLIHFTVFLPLCSASLNDYLL